MCNNGEYAGRSNLWVIHTVPPAKFDRGVSPSGIHPSASASLRGTKLYND